MQEHTHTNRHTHIHKHTHTHTDACTQTHARTHTLILRAQSDISTEAQFIFHGTGSMSELSNF